MKTTELANITGTDVVYNRRSGRYAGDGQRTTVLAVNVNAAAFRRSLAQASWRGTARLTDEENARRLAQQAQLHADLCASIGVDPETTIVRVEDDANKCVALRALKDDGTPVTGSGVYYASPDQRDKQVVLLVRPTWVRGLWSEVEARREASARIRQARRDEERARAAADAQRAALALPTWQPALAALEEAGLTEQAEEIRRNVTVNGWPVGSVTVPVETLLRLLGHELPALPEVSEAVAA